MLVIRGVQIFFTKSILHCYNDIKKHPYSYFPLFSFRGSEKKPHFKKKQIQKNCATAAVWASPFICIFIFFIYVYFILIFYEYQLQNTSFWQLKRAFFKAKYPQFVFLTNYLCKNAQNRSINHPRKKRFVQFLQCFIKIIKYLHIFAILT